VVPTSSRYRSLALDARHGHALHLHPRTLEELYGGEAEAARAKGVPLHTEGDGAATVVAEDAGVDRAQLLGRGCLLRNVEDAQPEPAGDEPTAEPGRKRRVLCFIFKTLYLSHVVLCPCEPHSRSQCPPPPLS